MKTTKGITREIAVCQVCGKKNEKEDKAQQWAYFHAKNTGHTVLIEIFSFIKYEPCEM